MAIMDKRGFLLVIYLIQYAIAQPACNENNHYLHDGVCYYFGSDRKTWHEAQMDCRDRGPDSDLVLITNQGVQDFLQSQASSRSTDRAWIGLREERTDWHWVKGNEREQYFSYQGCYGYNYINPIQMSFRVSISGVFTVKKCMEACSKEGKKYAGTVVDPDDAVTPLCQCGDEYDWTTAQTGCDTKCHSTSTETCGAVNKIIIYRIDGNSQQLWKKDQPNDFDGYQRCMSLNENNYKWADEECGDTYKYLCEYDKSESECRAMGDTYYDGVGSGKCISKHDDLSNWYKARTDCRSRGGDLLRTDSQTAWDYVVSTLSTQDRKRWWLAGSSHIWYWTNGAGLSYTNWAVAQPDERGEGCGCISRNSETIRFQWEDQPCNNKFEYICQIGSVLPTSTVGPSIATRPTTTSTPIPSSTTVSSTVSSTLSSTVSSTVSSSRSSTMSSTTVSSSSTSVSTTPKPTSTVAPTTTSTSSPPTPKPPPVVTQPPSSSLASSPSSSASTSTTTSSSARPSTTTSSSARPSTTTVASTTTKTVPVNQGSPSSSVTDGSGLTDRTVTDKAVEVPAPPAYGIIPKGVIVAIVVAGLAVLVGLVRLIVYCYQRSRRQQKSRTEELIYHEPYDGIKDFENPGYLQSTSEPKKSQKYKKNKAANSSQRYTDSAPPSVSSVIVGEASKPDEFVENGSELVYAY